MKNGLLILLLLLTACSQHEQHFNCDGVGLVITDNQAIYGTKTYDFCSKEGVYSTYSMNCQNALAWKIVFDSVAFKLQDIQYAPPPIWSRTTECKRVKP